MVVRQVEIDCEVNAEKWANECQQYLGEAEEGAREDHFYEQRKDRMMDERE